MTQPDQLQLDESHIHAVYDALLSAILSRELVPGLKLAEVTIAESFSVSRTVVRAALNRLHSEALVVFEKNRGAFVASPSVEEARQVFRLRILLERVVVERLAPIITEAQLARLERHTTDHLRQYRAHRDSEAMHSAEDFHLILAQMLGQGVLLNMLHRLIVRSALILALYGPRNASEGGIHEHSDLLAALRARDGQAAAEIMDRHLSGVVERARLAGKDGDARSLATILTRYAQAGSTA